MRRPLIAGNWKMNGSRQSVKSLLEGLKRGCERIESPELAVFPPYVYLDLCEQLLLRTQIAWGAQNVSDQPDGAFTGEISASMLNDFHCRYVIIGHSERRLHDGETNERVAKKFRVICEAKMIPIVCVGETLSQREGGKTLEIVSEQLAAVLKMNDNLASKMDFVIAYEPVWAIGTGQNASPMQAQEVHEAIREQLKGYDNNLADKTRLLYGGSVKPDNAQGLFAMPDIDGALVGGASLKAEQFLEIAQLCNHLS